MNPVTGLRLILGIGAAVALVFVWSNFVEWIQAPVQAKLEAAQKEAKDQAGRADAAEKAREELNRKLVERTARETVIEQRLEKLDRALRNLKGPKAIAQRDLELDPELVRATQYKANPSSLQSGPSADAASGTPAGSPGGRDAGRSPDPEKPAVRGSGEVQRPPARDRDPSIWEKLKGALK